MPKLIAMVSIYNSGEWIENRLNNLLKCDLEDIEVWCVNADSPDIRDHEIPQKYPFKYIKLPERISVYETWNYIIQNSDSQYITNANTDDIVAPNCYSKLISILDKDEKAGFAYCSWNTTSVPNQEWDKQTHIDPEGKPGKYNGNLETAGVGHFPLWRKSLHNKYGLFDANFKALADADWWARCFYVGNVKFRWHNENLALYLWRNGQNPEDRNLWNRMISAKEWELYHKKVAGYKNK